MKTSRNDNGNDAVRMELKYCEHCGGLWLRKSGTESVYCEKCRPKVAQLPPGKKSPGRVILPVAKSVVIHQYDKGEELDLDELEFEAAGGVA